METKNETDNCPKPDVVEGTFQGKTYRLRKRKMPNGERSPFWYVDFELRGKRFNQSTGSASVGTAHQVAKKKLGAAMAKRWSALEETKLNQEIATIGKILTVFKEGIAARADLGAKTIRGYGYALGSMLRAVHGEKVIIENLSTSVLTRELVQKFKEKRFPKEGTIGEKETAMDSANSTITQARSLFAKQAMELYHDRGLKLPDLTGFKEVNKFALDRDVSFRPIPPETLAEMDAAAWSLLEADPRRAVQLEGGTVDSRLVPARPDIFCAYLMVRYLGMRDIEIVTARWDWLEQWADGWRMAIMKRAYFKPKATEGRVPVDAAVYELLRKHGGRSEDGSQKGEEWIVPARHKTEREITVYRDANFFLRRWLSDREKAMHELRKQAGSQVYTETRSLSMAAEFLRNKEGTCKKHYSTMLVQPPALRIALPVAKVA